MPLSRRQGQVLMGEDAPSADYTVTTTKADVTGSSLAFTTRWPNAKLLATACFNINETVDLGALNLLSCFVDLDGADLRVSIQNDAGVAEEAQEVTLTAVATVASAGAHTLKMRAQKTTATGTVAILAAGSVITYTVWDSPGQ